MITKAAAPVRCIEIVDMCLPRELDLVIGREARECRTARQACPPSPLLSLCPLDVGRAEGRGFGGVARGYCKCFILLRSSEWLMGPGLRRINLARTSTTQRDKIIRTSGAESPMIGRSMA